VVHCDLKPSNIMVGAHGEVYVMDWGIARVLPGGPPDVDSPAVPGTLTGDLNTDSPNANGNPQSGERTHDQALKRGTATGTFSGGTPVYMAPEQANSQSNQIDPRTDVFGLGAVLYEILTGTTPYSGTTLLQILSAAKARDLLPPDERAPTRVVSPELRRVCLKAMERSKDDRYANVAEFAHDLRAILRGGGWFESRNFAPGEVIVREGESSDRAFVLKQGTCKVVRGSGLEQRLLRSLHPGDVFGEAGLITGERRSATVIAETQVAVQVVSSQGLKHELARQGLVGEFLKALATRFLDVDKKLFDASQRTPPSG
jgi:serine/threonine-protein kinase